MKKHLHKHTYTQRKQGTAEYLSQANSYLNSLSAWMTVLNESVSSGLDVIDLLLPKLQLPHQSLRHDQRVTMQTKTHASLNFLGKSQNIKCHERNCLYWSYRVVLFLRCHVRVTVTPVKVDLLLLLIIQPHELFSGSADESMELIKVPQTRLR